jgi:hypothetical protein
MFRKSSGWPFQKTICKGLGNPEESTFLKVAWSGEFNRKPWLGEIWVNMVPSALRDSNLGHMEDKKKKQTTEHLY